MKQLKNIVQLNFIAFLCGASTFCYSQVPTITSFSPTSGPVGTEVTITGTNFDATPANNIVYFGAVQAVVISATVTELTVTLPMGATYHPLVVVTNGYVAYSSIPFVVTSAGGVIDATSFITSSDFGTFSAYPKQVAIGDLDGDGKADLAVANFSGGTVAVFHNTSPSPGTINFAAAENFAAGGGGPRSIAIGDLDGDGKLDLAATRFNSDRVITYRNISTGPGDINFASGVNNTTGGGPFSVAIGDIDSDGKVDLAVANYSSHTVSVFRNTSTGPGSINFDLKDDYPTVGTWPQSIAIGDIDGDNKPDVAIANSGSSFSVLRNTTSGPGAINFATAANTATGAGPTWISMGDLDGDDKLDVAVTNINIPAVSVFRNTSSSGAVSFAAGENFATGNVPASVSISDLDGDGKLDLAVVNSSSNTVSVFQNLSSGPGTIDFTTKEDDATGPNPSSISIGDLDLDGKPDLVFSNEDNNTVSVFRNLIANTETDIESFTLPEQTSPATIDAVNHTIHIEVTNGTNLSTLIPTISLSTGATISPMSGAAQDFTNSVVYAVTAEDLVTTQDWTVKVYEPLPTFTDVRDGNTYKYVDIGNQKWMAENLKYLPNVIHPSNESAVAPFYYVYQYYGTTDDLISAMANPNYDTYGVLYNWTSAMDGNGSSNLNPSGVQGVCPNGWHLPSSTEWAELETFIGGSTEGGKLKETGTTYWQPQNDGATNEFLFAALPSGRKVAGGLFSSATWNGYWWTSTESNSVNTWVRSLDYAASTFWNSGIAKEAGHCVRCVKDISTETDIVGFTLPEQFSPANIDAVNHIVDIEVNYGTSLTSLMPTIELSEDATISPLSGTAQDFSSFFIYTVTAEDGVTEQNWTVIVTVTTSPYISGFLPTTAGNGTTVTIDGANFTGTTAVSFGGNVATSFVVNTDEKITAIVDVGATGDVSVTTPEGTVSLPGFNFISTPIINSVTPLSGPIGSEVVLSGENFSTTEAIHLTEAMLTGGSTKTWKLRPAAESIGVGPEVGSVAHWPYGADISDDRPCLFNDEFIFKSGGIYEYQANGDIYAEPYMGISEGCSNEAGVILAVPDATDWTSGIHSFTFTEATGVSNAQITVSGTGAFIGLPKAYNGGEYLTTPPTVDGTVTYEVTDYLNDGVNETLVLSIDVSTDGSLFWKFVLSKDGANVFIPPPNSIEFNGTATTATTSTINDLTVTVPTGATSGTISVTVLDQTATSGDSFTVLSSETDIISFSIDEQTGAATINTTNHTVDIEVISGTDVTNLSPTITYSTGASITPLSGAATDFSSAVVYTVTAEDGVTIQDWTVSVSTISEAIPTISSFTPTNGAIGSTVTIVGTNFDPVPANNIVFFGATDAIVIAATVTELSVIVPVGASYKPITVNTNGLLAYSSAPFTVTFAGGGTINITSFDAKLNYAPELNPHSVAIGDLDGDGKSDMVVANSGSSSLSLYRNTTADNSTKYTLTVDDYIAMAASTSASNPLGSSNLFTYQNFSLTLWSLSEISAVIGNRLNELFSSTIGQEYLVTYMTYEPGNGTRTINFNFDGAAYLPIAGSISFATKQEITTGAGPRSVVMGDFDGDGRPDLATANVNIGENTISVFRNTGSSAGTISYTTKKDYTTGASPIFVAAEDLDGDGKVDLVVANLNSNSISVFRNLSTGPGVISFDTKVDFTTDLEPLSLAIGDMDSDGKPDIAVANESGNSISIFHNTSSGAGVINFAAKVDLTAGTKPESVAIGDLDGDDKPDLAIVNYSSSTLSIFRNTSLGPGTINFDPKEDYPTGTNPFAVAIGDLNGDSKPDLAVANTISGTISVFENTSTNSGTITYGNKIDFEAEVAPVSVSIGDIDGDGKSDIAVTNYNNHIVSLFKNTIIAQSEIDRVALMALYNSTDGANWTTNSNWGAGADLSTWYGVTTDENGVVTNLDLSTNNLVGTLPSELGNMSNLITLNLRENSITGAIPIELGNLTNLTVLSLAFNSLLGSIPAELGNLTNLNALIIDFNAFTGTIPIELTYLPSLTAIYLGGNLLEGAVPSEFSNMSGLTNFNLFDNQFDVLPDFSSASWIGSITEFRVESNKFSFEDLVPNKGINGFSYSPQQFVDDEIVAVVYTNHEYVITVNESDPNTVFDWKKDGESMGGVGQQNTRTLTGFSTADEGAYTCEMANTEFPGFLITRNSIVLTENPDPIAHFTFSGDAIDQTGNGHNGTIVGATPSNDRFGDPNASYHFNGVTNYIKTASEGILNTDEQGCFYFWFYIEEMRTTQALFSYNKNEASYGAIVYVKDNLLKFQYSVPGTEVAAGFTGTNTINAGMWYQVAVSNDLSGQSKLYLNGTEEIFSFDNGGTSADGTEWMADLAMTVTSHVSIGAFYHNNNAEFPTLGSIDDVRIYNRGLSSLEIFNLYDAEASMPTITSFTPTSAGTGETVTITGTNLGTTTEVNFSGMVATSFDIVSNISVEAVVGEGDPDPGYVFITTTSGVASLEGFTYVPDLSINSFNPASGETGTEVIVVGNGFSDDLYSFGNSVTISGTEAAIKSIAPAEIVVTVPFDIVSGKIEVNLNGQTVTSADNFVIIPTITAEDFPATFNFGESLEVSLGLNNAATASDVRFHSKGISEGDAAWQITSISPVEHLFTATITDSDISDAIGIEYYFTVDYTGGQLTSSNGSSYVNYPSSSIAQEIPELTYGDQISNYQIISIPLELDNSSVANVFDELMPYDITLWRLYDYANGDNREYDAFNTIGLGKGYWLIFRNSSVINPGGGAVPQVNSNNPFSMPLASGWNLIGNPYNFNVSWSDVLNHNGNSDVGNLNTFSGGTLSENATLHKYRGGFVFNGGSATTIEIPVTKTTGGRKEDHESPTDLGEPYWELGLNLIQGQLRNEVGGIGMHPEATISGKDHFDQVSVPMISGMGFFELGFDHPEYSARFNKEIVTTTINYTWEVEVVRDNEMLPVVLNWDNTNFGDNDNQLYLYDPATLQLIDMRVQQEYEVGVSSNQLQLLFGKQEYIDQQLNSQFPLVGEPYPNPTNGSITLPYKISTKNSSNVLYKIYDNTGKLMMQNSEIMDTGIHYYEWQFEKSGLYIIQLQIEGETISRKIIVN